jgi:hypothetical protein
MQVLWKDVVRLVPPRMVIKPEFGFALSVQDQGQVFDEGVVSAATSLKKELQGFLPAFTVSPEDGSPFHELATRFRTVDVFRSTYGVPQEMS